MSIVKHDLCELEMYEMKTVVCRCEVGTGILGTAAE
jgi:hypothetical protein